MNTTFEHAHELPYCQQHGITKYRILQWRTLGLLTPILQSAGTKQGRYVVNELIMKEAHQAWKLYLQNVKLKSAKVIDSHIKI